MKVFKAIKYSRLPVAVITLILCAMFITDGLAAQAGQILLNGRVKSIELTTNTVVVTSYEGKDIRLSIEDQEILNKFKEGRIKVDDDVNVKYIIKDGKNIPVSFRKTAGC
jgi:hypothetical protein